MSLDRDGVPVSQAELERLVIRRLNALVAARQAPVSATGREGVCGWCGLEPRRERLCEGCEAYHTRLLAKYPDEARSEPSFRVMRARRPATPPWMPFKEAE